MSNWMLNLYHHLPPPLRNAAATVRGYQLRRWRYGPETERLVAEALERDHWSPEQWKTYQENRLSYILHRAATQVPYYRNQWAERRRKGDRASWDYLENWPILEKEPLRQNPWAFVADGLDVKKMFHEHTSGTTGKPINLWWSRETIRGWYALFEARWRRWYGLTRHDRWAIMGGQLVVPIEQTRPPFWVWNEALNQLYFSSYHLAPSFLPTYLEALKRFRIKYIYAYTSSVYALAQEILRSKLSDTLQIETVITNAEQLYEYQREAIAAAFCCHVRETYGMSEIVTAAGECEHGRLHLWPEVGFMEVLEENGTVSLGEIGELVCTSLMNEDMPFIRYRVGDRARLDIDQEPCTCGRQLPRLGAVEGRQDDLLLTADGRRVGRLDPVFKSTFPIREAQIVQERLDYVLVRLVPSEGYKTAVEESIRQQIQARMGQVQVAFEKVDKIPRTSNGKFRAVICNLSPEERERISKP
jgi:phenylacetate-CoA ligase